MTREKHVYVSSTDVVFFQCFPSAIESSEAEPVDRVE